MSGSLRAMADISAGSLVMAVGVVIGVIAASWPFGNSLAAGEDAGMGAEEVLSLSLFFILAHVVGKDFSLMAMPFSFSVETNALTWTPMSSARAISA